MKNQVENIIPDFKILFERSPVLYLVLTTHYFIIAASDAYTEATLTKKEDIIGKNIFDVFPDNPHDPRASGVQNLKASLDRVLATKQSDIMAIQKYDIKIPNGMNEIYEERFWSPVNSPVLNNLGEVLYIIHRVEDVTEFANLIKNINETSKTKKKLMRKMELMEVDIFNRNKELKDANTKYKINELQLRNVTDRLSLILNSSNNALIVINSEGLISDWNKKSEVLFGWSANEVLGIRLDQFIIPKRYIEAHRLGMNKFLQTGRGPFLDKRIEIYAHNKWGVEFPIEMSINAIKLSDKYIFCAFISDMSERKKNELYKSLQIKLISLFTESFTLEDLLIKSIELFNNQLGWEWGAFWKHHSKEKNMSISFSRSIEFSDYENFKELSLSLKIKQGEGFPGKVWESRKILFINHFDDEYILLRKFASIDLGLKSAIGIPVYFGEKFYGVIEFFKKDNEKPNASLEELITDYSSRLGSFIQKIESDENLKASEERFRQMVICVKDYAIFMIDPNGLVITWNDGAKRLKGYDSQEIIGKHFSLFYTEEDRESKKPESELLIATNMGVVEDTGWRVKKDGTKFWANIIINRINDDHGNLIGFSKITRDLTDKKKAEDAQLNSYLKLEKRVEQRTYELTQALRSRDEFLLIASHELKTPLTSLKLRLQLARRSFYKTSSNQDFGGAPTKNEFDKILFQALEQIESLTHLVNDLLDASRIQTGKFDLHLQRVNFSILTQSVLNQYKEQFLAANCKVDSNIKENIFVRCDPFRMEQVLVNLISNALKYAPENPIEIYLKNNDANTHLIFSIKDHGPGIDPLYHNVIFERFERLSSYQHIGGLGLGLFIVKKIIQSHNGFILLDSNLGEGASFMFEIPLDIPLITA